MTVKPIDLQTNISQMLEVGRNEQAKSGAVAEQQHLLDKESSDKSKLVDSKLDETKKGEKTAIMDEESKKKQGMKGKKEKSSEEKKKDKELEKEVMKDERIGRNIDVFK